MEHRIDWQLNNEGAFVSLTYPEPAALKLSCGQLVKEISGLKGDLQIFRLGRWIVQRNAEKISITCLSAPSADLQIAFAGQGVTAKVTLDGPPQWTKEFPQASSLLISDSRLTVTDRRTQASAARPAQGTTGTRPAASSAARPSQAPAGAVRPAQTAASSSAQVQELQAERDQLRQQLTAAKQRVSAAEARVAEVESASLESDRKLMAAQSRIAELTQQLAVATQANEAAAQLGASRAEAADLTARLQELQSANTQVQAEITRLQAEHAAAKSQQGGLQAERAALEEQIRQLQQAKIDSAVASGELTTLDAEACSQRLAAQRQELLSDANALALLQQDNSIRCRSVVENQEECARLIEHIEKRIAAIVALRERIDQTVWRTIDTGENEGSIPRTAEAGEF